MSRGIYRRRTTRVYSPHGYDGGKGYETQLDIRPDHVRIIQTRLGQEIVMLDLPTMDYLIELWGEVRDDKRRL